jgi:hypothetical protein
MHSCSPLMSIVCCTSSTPSNAVCKLRPSWNSYLHLEAAKIAQARTRNIIEPVWTCYDRYDSNYHKHTDFGHVLWISAREGWPRGQALYGPSLPVGAFLIGNQPTKVPDSGLRKVDLQGRQSEDVQTWSLSHFRRFVRNCRFLKPPK